MDKKEAQEKIEDSIEDLAAIIQADGEYTARGSFVLAREIYEAGYHKEEKTYRLCVKTCAILNKIMLDYPEVKLGLYLKSIGQLSRE